MNNDFENLKDEIKNEIENEQTGEPVQTNEAVEEQVRFIALSPDTPVDIEGWKEIIKDNFEELVLPAEAGLSVIAQLLIEDIKNPFALIYVDVPSSGKTIALNFFSMMRELVITLDNITPASFVTQAANVQKDKLKDIDLLPRIRYKTLIIRDFAPVFAGKEEKVQEMFGILVRVLDGEGYENSGGVHGQRGYSGEYLFMLLGASTPIRSNIWKIMGNLGSRLFFLNIDGKEDTEQDLLEQLEGDLKGKEFICRDVTKEFIKTLWAKHPEGVAWKKDEDDRNAKLVSVRFSNALAKLRGAINVSRDEFSSDRRYNHSQPVIEKAKRINAQLYNLARGHALLYGRTHIEKSDLPIVAKVAIDSAPPKRSKIFKHMILHGGSLGTQQVMDALKVSRPIALKTMRELELLEIVDVAGNLDDENHYYGKPEQRMSFTEKFSWFRTDECRALVEQVASSSLLTESAPVSVVEEEINIENKNESEHKNEPLF